MLREQSGHARKRKLTAIQKAIGVAADTPWVTVSDDEVARAAAAEARMSVADAERPPLQVSARLRVAAGLDVLAQFARADLLRCAWDLWQEKILERRAAWVAVQEAEARVRARVADRLLNGPPAKAARHSEYCSVCDAQTLPKYPKIPILQIPVAVNLTAPAATAGPQDL